MNTKINQHQFKRIVAIGDPHGCIGLLRKLVEQVIQFNKQEDCLVFLGDYIDYRSANKEVSRNGVSSLWVVEYVSELRKKYPDRIILLKGNHELMAQQYFQSNSPRDFDEWRLNGSTETISSFGSIETTREVLVPFIESLSLYAESEDYVFVHGCIPYDETLQTASEEELLNCRYFEVYRGEKILIVGHSVHGEVTFYPRAIVVDTGAFRSGKLSAFDVINQKIYEAVDP